MCRTEELDEAEDHFITLYDCISPNGFNLRSGGHAQLAREARLSPETLAKMERVWESNRGRGHTSEVVEAARQRMLGKRLPDHVRAQISQRQTGRKRPESTHGKIVEKIREQATQHEYVHEDTGEVVVAAPWVMAERYGKGQGGYSDVACGRERSHNGWLLNNFCWLPPRVDEERRQQVLRAAADRAPKVWFTNKVTGERVFKSKAQMAADTGIGKELFRDLQKGRRSVVGDWILTASEGKEPPPHKDTHTFCNRTTGEEVTCTRPEMHAKMGGSRVGWWNLVDGKAKSYSDWVLVPAPESGS